MAIRCYNDAAPDGVGNGRGRHAPGGVAGNHPKGMAAISPARVGAQRLPEALPRLDRERRRGVSSPRAGSEKIIAAIKLLHFIKLG